jgi:transposase
MDAKFADVPDALWIAVESLLPPEKAKPKGGRPLVPSRRVLAGVVYRLRTGCQWRALPREFGSGTTCHRRYSQWVKAGIFVLVWREMLALYDSLKGIDWEWSAIDGATIKAPKGGTTLARTRRIAPSEGASATS